MSNTLDKIIEKQVRSKQTLSIIKELTCYDFFDLPDKTIEFLEKRILKGLTKVLSQAIRQAVEEALGDLPDCGLMIETIQGYLDQALETDQSNNYKEILKASDHLNTLNRMLLGIHGQTLTNHKKLLSKKKK